MGNGGGRRKIRKPSYNEYSKKVTDANPLFQDDCESFNVEILLVNLQPALVKYRIGDILEITLDANDNIIAIGEHGICGNVTPLNSRKLIECIKRGKTFKAVIIGINATSCRVRISIKL